MPDVHRLCAYAGRRVTGWLAGIDQKRIPILADHDTNDDHGNGFAIPLPLSLLASMADSHDRHHMTSEVVEHDVHRLLDALDVQQLITVRRILNSGTATTSNNYVDGQIVSILRLVHRVDHVTGESLEVEAFGDVPAADGQAGARG